MSSCYRIWEQKRGWTTDKVLNPVEILKHIRNEFGSMNGTRSKDWEGAEVWVFGQDMKMEGCWSLEDFVYKLGAAYEPGR